MSVYMAPLEDDDEFKQKEDLGRCPKCGRVGCECDPETCDCEPPVEEILANVHNSINKQKNLIQDFE
jgi:hypothetical protein